MGGGGGGGKKRRKTRMHKQTISAYEGRAEGLEGDNEALQRPNTAESQTGGHVGDQSPLCGWQMQKLPLTLAERRNLFFFFFTVAPPVSVLLDWTLLIRGLWGPVCSPLPLVR